MSPRSLTLLLLPALAGFPSSCAAPDASITPRYGPLDLDGELSFSSAGPGAPSDTGALGLDDEEALTPRVDLVWDRFRVSLSGYDVEYEGIGTAQGPFDAGGVTIPAGTGTESKLDLRSAGLLLTWDLLPGEAVELGVGLGAAAFDFDASIRSLATNDVLPADGEVILPVAAVRAGLEVFGIPLTAAASAFRGEHGGLDGTYVDGDVALEQDLTRALDFPCSLLLGYRHLVADFEFDEGGSRFDGDLTFSGLYFGLTIEL